jgi:hypothetical protein
MNRSNINNDDSGSNYQYHQKQNNDDDEDDNNNNTGTQTVDLLDLFSTTMHSLAADAAAIRQITDLAELTGIILSDNNGIKKHGNKNNANEEEEEEEEENGNDRREFVQELCDLDRLISGVEQKVIALRQIINEENSALTKFETNLRDEADEQATLIEDLMSALDLQQQQQQQHDMLSSSNDRDDNNRWHARHQKSSDNEDADEWQYRRHENNDQRQHQYQYHDKKHIQLSKASSNSNNNSNNNNNTYRRGVLKSRTMGKMGNQSSPHPSRGVNGSRISHNKNNINRNDLYKLSLSSPEKMNNGSCYGDDKDEEQEEEDPYFVKVTKSEILEQTPSFGVHLSRFDLNEALEEIERIVWNKISLEPKSSIYSSGSSSPSHISSNTLQRRFDYLRHRQRGPNAGSDNETEAHVGHRWVSEQELRENCAFFRHGESTARATLQLLCSLKRLKQVPGKNREVTYLCLFR